MRQVIVRYRVKPDQVERNAELVRAVYEELHGAQPDGFRYATFRLDDGVSFVHFAIETGTVRARCRRCPRSSASRRDIRERCDEPPVVSELSEVGSFRL